EVSPRAKHREGPKIGIVGTQPLGGVELRERVRGSAGQHERYAETVVRQGEAWIQLQRLAELGDAGVVIAERVVGAPEDRVAARVLVVERDGLPRRFECAVDVLLRRRTVAQRVIKEPAERERGKERREAGVEGRRSLEELPGRRVVFRAELPDVPEPALV